MLARWSWPRFRYDQLMDLGWKVMIPWGLVNLVVVAVWMEYGDRLGRGWRAVGRGAAWRRSAGRCWWLPGCRDRGRSHARPITAAAGDGPTWPVNAAGAASEDMRTMKPNDQKHHLGERAAAGAGGQVVSCRCSSKG